ncbi:MAG TPA: type II toxin-antitoxin system HicB family antitoxin [Candidatus Woesebacteria bacterium]|nr:type II toxin-antitoxin system HicB family antitoxin [Candidatus Woesebacteria bacterium]
MKSAKMNNKKTILDYRVIVKPDKRTGSNKDCYVATCPTLGLTDDGTTVEEAISNVRQMIIFHLDCLEKEGREIPVDTPQSELVTSTQIEVSLRHHNFAY